MLTSAILRQRTYKLDMECSPGLESAAGEWTPSRIYGEVTLSVAAYQCLLGFVRQGTRKLGD